MLLSWNSDISILNVSLNASWTSKIYQFIYKKQQIWYLAKKLEADTYEAA